MFGGLGASQAQPMMMPTMGGQQPTFVYGANGELVPKEQ